MQFEQLLESRTAKYVMFDITWCGGLTEAHKIAAMADAIECRSLRTPPGTAAVLRDDASHYGVAQRVDPGKLPAILRARLAGDAGEPNARRMRFDPRAGGDGLRDAD